MENLVCYFCHRDAEFDVTYQRHGGKYHDAHLCKNCIDELRIEGVEFGIVDVIKQEAK